MYNFYKVDNKLRQSAWSLLQFDFDIKHIYTYNNSFRFIVVIDNAYQVLELDLKDLARPEKVLLDIKQDITFVNGVADVEVLTDDMVVIDNQESLGNIVDYVDNEDGTITAPDLVNIESYTCYLGKIYETIYAPRLPVDTTQRGNLSFNSHMGNIYANTIITGLALKYVKNS